MKQRKIIALCLLAAALALPGCGEKPAPDTQPPASSADTSAPTASAEETTVSAEVTTASAEVTTDTDATSAPATAGTPAATTEPPEVTTETTATTEPPEATTETTATAATAEATADTTAATSATTSAADTTAATSATTEKNVNELIDIANSRQNGADYFVSPYRQISHIGDPFVLYDEASGKYYMYCTGGKFRCWSSDTFKSWTELGDAYTVTEKSFGTQNYWAPEVYKWNGAYYMVYSAARKVEGSLSSTGLRHSIGLAKADNPAGPFTDVYDHPLFAPDYSVIDASLLFDDDGKIYLYYARDCSENVVNGKKTSQVYGIELASDL